MNMRPKRKLVLTIVLLVALQLASLVSAKAYAEKEKDAQSAIGNAQEMLTSAFKATLEAEKSGANVTFLSERLTQAGSYLSSAILLYEAQNFSQAKVNADSCYEIAQSVDAEANDLLGYPAAFARFQTFSLKVLGYVLSVCAIVLLGIVSWRFFKKRYFGRILKMRPEAIS